MGHATDPHKPDALGFIPGIFNYCDRWCEKCRFIRQCRVGAVEADEVRDEDVDEVAPERVEGHDERMQRMLDDLHRMQEEQRKKREADEPEAEEEGDGFDDEEDDDEEDDFDFEAAFEEPSEEEMQAYRKRREELRAQVKAHPLTNLSETYMELCDEWLEEHEEALRARGIDLHRRAGQQLVPLPPEGLVLHEAVEEVSWFKTMLPVKTNRCISGKIEDPDFMERIGLDPVMSDENGTAKLVLHILDRCETAWTTIAELWPEQAGATVPVLELIRRHRALMKQEFPLAERFIRPGFDAPRVS